MNIGTKPIDLRGVRLAGAVKFTFSETQPLLAAGARILVIRNTTVFNSIYGTGLSIAGEYSGNLDNGGEALRVLAPDGAVLRSFTFDDTAPWPGGTDGQGHSLVFVRPQGNASPGNANAWRPSVGAGGNPGTSDAVSFASWAASNGVNGASNDVDGDSLPNVFEYVFGSSPSAWTARPWSVAVETVAGQPSALILTAQTALSADEADLSVEICATLPNWQPASPSLLSYTPNGDGSATRVWRVSLSANSPAHFIRLRATLSP
jgi:hypothetical protein